MLIILISHVVHLHNVTVYLLKNPVNSYNNTTDTTLDPHKAQVTGPGVNIM